MEIGTSPSASVVAADATNANVATIDYVQVYRQACAECSCRVNSAVLKALSAAPTQTLLHLNLRNNYVGPKGFGPLLQLIDRCQTVTSIDLGGNGLDNGCVDRLCDVLKDHLGVVSVNLSDNPITNDAGKPLMGLLAQNRNITALGLDRVDVFDALRDRIAAAVEENRGVRDPSLNARGGDDADFANTNNGTAAGSSTPAASRGGVSAVSINKASIGRGGAQSAAPTAVRVSMINSSKVSVRDSSGGFGFGGSSTASATMTGAAPHLLTPKPPTPALAANDNARLTNAQQAAMRAKYKQRKDQYNAYNNAVMQHHYYGGGSDAGNGSHDQLRLTNGSDGAATNSARMSALLSAERSDASKAAATARYQLMMLEEADARSSQVLQVAQRAEAERAAEAKRIQDEEDRRVALELRIREIEAEQAAEAAARAAQREEEEEEAAKHNSNTNNDNNASSMEPSIQVKRVTSNATTNGTDGGASANNTLNSDAAFRAFVSETNHSDGGMGGGNNNSNSNVLLGRGGDNGSNHGSGGALFAHTVGPSSGSPFHLGASESAVGQKVKKRASFSDAAIIAGAGDSASNSLQQLPFNGPAVTSNAAGQTVTISKDPTVAPFVVPPTREEHFKALFDEGCEAYKNKAVDLAFLRWSEAAAFAQEHRNREWIAIVTSNMQRLSYDMLVADGTQALEAGRLDEAEKHFAFGMDVALKAKNSVWEAEMTKARRNVQYAVFQREQDNSTMVFEKAVRAPDEVLTDEDLFLGPDGVRIVSHTTAFHNEWRRMLPIREALAGWVDASRVASKISGPSSRVLLDIVSSSILNVTQYFIKTFYSEALNADTTAILPQQGTSRYRYDELEALRRLWEEIIADTVPLNCPAFQAIGRCHLGHLCLALNRLSDAISHLRAAVAIAESIGDATLAAISGTYLAMVHHQARDYADTERCLERSIALWEAISGYGKGGGGGGTNNKDSANKMGGGSEAGGGGDSTFNDDLGGAGPKSQQLPNARAVQKGPLVAVDPASTTTTTTGTSGDLAVGHVIDTTANGNGGASSADGTIRVPVTPSSSIAADALLSNIGAALRGSPFYRHVPQEVLRHLHRHCYHLMVSILVTPPRSKYLAALEVLELSLQTKYADALASKVAHNFATRPTIDHIAAVATSGKSMLVYLKVTTDFRWNIDSSRFEVHEYLHSWCVPEGGDISFTTIDVREVSKAPSIAHMVGGLRNAFRVNPLAWASSQQYQQQQQEGGGGMILSYPPLTSAWITPLRALHAAIVEPLTSFIQSHNAYDPSRVLTIIPSDGLWAVPFGALLGPDMRTFFIEEIAIQLSFSGIYATFASLNGLQAKERDSSKVVLVKCPSTVDAADPTSSGVGAQKYGLLFPLDKDRSEEETLLVSEAISKGLALGAPVKNPKRNSRSTGIAGGDAEEAAEGGAYGGDVHASASTRVGGAPTAPTHGVLSNSIFRNAQLTRHHRFVEDAVAVKEAMVGARLIHIAAPSSNAITFEAQCVSGGICVTAEYGEELALVHNKETSKLDLFAQLVTLSNTSLDPSLLGGLRDGTLCTVRAFLAAGCPAVVAGMWCTPDMFPVDLFQRLYLLHLEPQPVALSELKPTGPRPAAPPRSGASASYTRAKDSSAAAASSAGGSKVPIIKRRNKALAMAMAIRELLNEGEGAGGGGPIDYRTAPHHWAGYFMVGVGE